MLSQGGVVVTYASSAATLLLAIVCPGVTQVYAACAGLASIGLAASSFGMALNTAGFFLEIGDALTPALGHVLGKEEDHVVTDHELTIIERFGVMKLILISFIMFLAMILSHKVLMLMILVKELFQKLSC